MCCHFVFLGTNWEQSKCLPKIGNFWKTDDVIAAIFALPSDAEDSEDDLELDSSCDESDNLLNIIEDREKLSTPNDHQSMNSDGSSTLYRIADSDSDNGGDSSIESEKDSDYDETS